MHYDICMHADVDIHTPMQKPCTHTLRFEESSKLLLMYCRLFLFTFI